MTTVLLRPYPRAPLAATNFLTGSSSADAASYTTASATPVASVLYLLFVCSTAATVNTPTVTGQGQTWTQVATVVTGANSRRITLFRALGGATAGTLTIDFAGQTQTNCEWTTVVCVGADASGTNGSGAIVQSKTNDAGAATSGSITMTGALGSPNNRVVGAFIHQGFEASTATAPAVKIGDTSHSAPDRGFASLSALNPPGPTLAMSWTTSSSWSALAVEVKAAA